MVRFLALAVAAALCCAQPAGTAAAAPRWHELHAQPSYGAAQYAADFGRAYAPEERAQRYALIEARLAAIRAHNAGGASYKQVRRAGPRQ